MFSPLVTSAFLRWGSKWVKTKRPINIINESLLILRRVSQIHWSFTPDAWGSCCVWLDWRRGDMEYWTINKCKETAHAWPQRPGVKVLRQLTISFRLFRLEYNLNQEDYHSVNSTACKVKLYIWLVCFYIKFEKRKDIPVHLQNWPKIECNCI